MLLKGEKMHHFVCALNASLWTVHCICSSFCGLLIWSRRSTACCGFSDLFHFSISLIPSVIYILIFIILFSNFSHVDLLYGNWCAAPKTINYSTFPTIFKSPHQMTPAICSSTTEGDARTLIVQPPLKITSVCP